MATKVVNIALAADTILYLPIYLLEKERRRKDAVQINLLPSGQPKGGDKHACDLVRDNEAELCLCDPMVAISNSHLAPPNGVAAVASMVSRLGLWGVTTPFISFDSRKSDVLEDAATKPEASIRTILTYKTASSGWKALEYLRQKYPSELSNTKFFQAEFGGELAYLTQPYSEDGAETPIELIVTCDLVGVLAADAQRHTIVDQARQASGWGGRAKHPPRIGIRFHEKNGFDQCLFTALIGRKDFIEEERPAVLSIVSGLQGCLDDFYRSNERDLRVIAQYLCQEKSIFPSVGPHSGAIIKCDEERQEDYCYEALRYLRDNKILSRSVRLSRSEWESACAIWKVEKSPKRRDPHFFNQYTNRSIASEAHPGEIKRRIQIKWRRYRGLIFSIAGTYGLAGSTLGVLGKTIDTTDAWVAFGTLVTLTGVISWVLSRWILGLSSVES